MYINDILWDIKHEASIWINVSYFQYNTYIVRELRNTKFNMFLGFIYFLGRANINVCKIVSFKFLHIWDFENNNRRYLGKALPHSRTGILRT